MSELDQFGRIGVNRARNLYQTRKILIYVRPDGSGRKVTPNHENPSKNRFSRTFNFLEAGRMLPNNSWFRLLGRFQNDFREISLGNLEKRVRKRVPLTQKSYATTFKNARKPSIFKDFEDSR